MLEVNAIVEEVLANNATPIEIDSVKARLKETWMADDYNRFLRYMEQGARIAMQKLGPLKTPALTSSAA